MARIKLDMPDNYLFTAEIPLRISDINYGGHLGNDAVLSLIHESRVQFLRRYGYTEMNVEGFGIIMTDTAIVYKSEGFYGDRIKVDVTIADFNKYGCDIYYLMSNKETATDVAHVKTGIVFFDYEMRKVVPLPEAFRENILKEV
jgi:acyl-CoA thioester hydrolase